MAELDEFAAGFTRLRGLKDAAAFDKQITKLLSFPTNKTWMEAPNPARDREVEQLVGVAPGADTSLALVVLSPLFRDMVVAEHVDNYHKQVGPGNDFNLGLATATLLEELLPLYDRPARNNEVRHFAVETDRARNEYLKRLRALRSAEQLCRKAEMEFRSREAFLIRTLSAKGIVPYNGTDQKDMTRWWYTSEYLLNSLKDRGLTASKLRYYVRQGLIPKPIRVGQGGKALYSPTTYLRLRIIYILSAKGSSLAEVREELPKWLTNLLDAGLDHAGRGLMGLIKTE